MERLLFLFVVLAMAVGAAPAWALNVFACEPEWAALVRELGGSRVAVTSATSAAQDPHRVEARPSLIARARQADLLVCTGAGLEIGWLPMVLAQAANPRIQPGQPGYFEAAAWVRRLEVPMALDRAQGDVHPGGNPHIQFDPRNMRIVAERLAQRLGELDPAHAGEYTARLAAFLGRWDDAMKRWQAQGATLAGVPVVVHHKLFSYLIAWLGMRQVAVLEPKPGIEPSAASLARVLETLADSRARLILRANYNDSRPAEWLASRTGLPVVVLPSTVGAEGSQDLFAFYDLILARLTGALR